MSGSDPKMWCKCCNTEVMEDTNEDVLHELDVIKSPIPGNFLRKSL